MSGDQKIFEAIFRLMVIWPRYGINGHKNRQVENKIFII